MLLLWPSERRRVREVAQPLVTAHARATHSIRVMMLLAGAPLLTLGLVECVLSGVAALLTWACNWLQRWAYMLASVTTHPAYERRLDAAKAAADEKRRRGGKW